MCDLQDCAQNRYVCGTINFTDRVKYKILSMKRQFQERQKNKKSEDKVHGQYMVVIKTYVIYCMFFTINEVCN